MDNYRHCSSPPCTKTYLGIDNIHVMRDSLQKVVDAIKDSDITPLPPNRELLARSGWIEHIGLLLDGTSIVVRQVAVEHSHVLIHCSDGWDRTSQLSSLAQICLDPYFRTIEGFIALVEKDWVGFGHRFRDRCGFLGSDKWFVEKTSNGPLTTDDASDPDDDSLTRTNTISPFSASAGALGEARGALEKGFGQAKNFFNTVNRTAPPPPEDDPSDPSSSSIDRKAKLASLTTAPAIITTKPREVSPVFHQFLDATYQLLQQNPTRFEYNERFLRRLLYHLYSCQYGTFLFNNDKERADARVRERTRSVWDYFLARRAMWKSEMYDPAADGVERERDVGGGRVLFPRSGAAVKWWEELWGRDGGEMNGVGAVLGIGSGGFEGERSRTPTVPGSWPAESAGSNSLSGVNIASPSGVNVAGVGGMSAATAASTEDTGAGTGAGTVAAVAAAVAAAALGAGMGGGALGVAGRLGDMVEGVKGLSIGVGRPEPTERRSRGSLEVEMI